MATLGLPIRKRAHTFCDTTIALPFNSVDALSSFSRARRSHRLDLSSSLWWATWAACRQRLGFSGAARYHHTSRRAVDFGRSDDRIPLARGARRVVRNPPRSHYAGKVIAASTDWAYGGRADIMRALRGGRCISRYAVGNPLAVRLGSLCCAHPQAPEIYAQMESRAARLTDGLRPESR